MNEDQDSRRSSTERAEEALDRAGETAGRYASMVGTRLARIAAFAREEMEDMWAEAQEIRHRERGGGETASTGSEEQQSTEQEDTGSVEPREIKATEAARRHAEELGVDLREVEGTGQEGQITVADIRKNSGSGS